MSRMQIQFRKIDRPSTNLRCANKDDFAKPKGVDVHRVISCAVRKLSPMVVTRFCLFLNWLAITAGEG